jgi:hypothetical protein
LRHRIEKGGGRLQAPLLARTASAGASPKGR